MYTFIITPQMYILNIHIFKVHVQYLILSMLCQCNMYMYVSKMYMTQRFITAYEEINQI